MKPPKQLNGCIVIAKQQLDEHTWAIMLWREHPYHEYVVSLWSAHHPNEWQGGNYFDNVLSAAKAYTVMSDG